MVDEGGGYFILPAIGKIDGGVDRGIIDNGAVGTDTGRGTLVGNSETGGVLGASVGGTLAPTSPRMDIRYIKKIIVTPGILEILF